MLCRKGEFNFKSGGEDRHEPTSQGTPRVASHHEKLGDKHGRHSLSVAALGNPCCHLNVELLSSRTVPVLRWQP